MTKLRRVTAPYDWPALLRLIRANFSYMEGRIDPPSSMLNLTADAIAAQASNGEVWVIEQNNQPIACIFLTPRDDVLYVGKLTVAQSHRAAGHARRLVETAVTRARDLNLHALELQSRVELLENHSAFTAMGFVQTGATAHPGFTQPTSLTFRKAV
ncbi:GNAT family N-acetyltransferase [Actibacterium lipolyticum]|uniref:Acetyltransferase (GNAT) family protein n=1 Tax=Actibacterium lipolyticum TaxID=1524263 RepID=A0A238JK43_9RHOB|nr:GNAT family N-acetyltransferase [Actibacterium lipolyticum]SMX30773.1 Acetyltransferase (GNAT) family protein [Actibacterium lipolyticum]